MEQSNNKQMENGQVCFLTAQAVLKYLLGSSEKIENMILCKSPDAEITTTDYEIYQALGSVKKYDGLMQAKLVKLLENVDVSSHKAQGSEKKILTHERVEELRKFAIKEANKNE